MLHDEDGDALEMPGTLGGAPSSGGTLGDASEQAAQGVVEEPVATASSEATDVAGGLAAPMPDVPPQPPPPLAEPQEFVIGSPLLAAAEPLDGVEDLNIPDIGGAIGAASASSTSADAAPTAETFLGDRVQHGVHTARSLWQWGFGRVKENAAKLTEDIGKSELMRETSRLGEQAKETVVHGASEAARLSLQISQQGISTVQTSIGQLHQDTSVHLSEAAGKTEEAAHAAREKAAEIAEHVKPKLQEAGKTAKTSFMGAVSGAAKTAIWFQSLGASRHDSSDEDIDSSGSPPPKKTPEEHGVVSSSSPLAAPAVGAIPPVAAPVVSVMEEAVAPASPSVQAGVAPSSADTAAEPAVELSKDVGPGTVPDTAEH